MKKKLLSLLMAGAVVAGTSVQAFAQNKTYNVLDTDTISAPVTITGQVSNSQGGAPSGRLEVEVPTALSFAVNQNGVFNAASFEIRNNSKDPIKVQVGSFRETQVTGGIHLWDDNSGFDTKDRSNVVLALRGDNKHVILKDGVKDQDLQVINGGGVATIQVLGDAGKSTSNVDVENNGVSETFELVFKITKN